MYNNNIPPTPPFQQGNEAFRDAEYDLAHELYTQALHALWPHPPLHPRLALLLSNRAASFLSQGKPLRCVGGLNGGGAGRRKQGGLAAACLLGFPTAGC